MKEMRNDTQVVLWSCQRSIVVFISFCLCFFTSEGDLLKTDHKFLNFFMW